jgi:hypothetical protein
VLTVGAPGQAFTTILAAAVDAAVDGDVILVRSGNYASSSSTARRLHDRRRERRRQRRPCSSATCRRMRGERVDLTIVGLPTGVAASGLRIRTAPGSVRVRTR